MQDFIQQKILLGVCGGIAAYKSAYLVRELTRLGATVKVIMTENAQAFITPLTFQALSGEEVRTSLFDSQAERAMSHIELARWMDTLVIAPASANCLAKLAQGLADDLLSTLYLVGEKPVLLCPAMNRSMWQHPATQSNFKLLKERGAYSVGPEEGLQACGEEGFGRLAEIAHILNALRLVPIKPVLKGRKVLITAGPTQEALDPIRYLSNHSSGKMGYALAEAAYLAGAEVQLISGPTALLPPSAGILLHAVKSAEEMYEATLSCLEKDMLFISAAAVADYRPAVVADKKIKKTKAAAFSLDLILNRDILAAVAAEKKAALVVGFAAETENECLYAKEKLEKKHAHVMIANRVGQDLGFHVDGNAVTLVTRSEMIPLEYTHKVRLAGKIIAILADKLQNNFLFA